MSTFRIPTPLRPYAGGQTEIAVDGSTVGEALNALTRQHEGLVPHLFGPDGQLRSYVNLYVNNEDIRDLRGLDTPIRPGDRLVLVPSIAGGR
jgi:molybdopterin converting factor small subunit